MKKRMQDLQLKSVDIVSKIDASKGSVSQWVNGISRPSGEKLLQLAHVLACDPEWLLNGGNAKKSRATEPNWAGLGKIDEWCDDTELKEDEVEVPFFTEVELSAGNGSSVVQENKERKLRFAKSTLRKCNVSISHAGCATAQGNSMEPVLPDGSTVGVDTSKKNIKDGDMYAIDHNGLLRIKLLYRLPGGGVRLKSYNHIEWPDEDYSVEEAKDIIIIGRVFWYSVLC